LRNNNQIFIFGLDQKFTEKILRHIICFRVDFILKYKNKLFIIEFKYRSDRRFQSTNAKKCICFKMYSERFLNVIKKFNENIFKDISLVYEVGLSVS